MVLRSFAFYSQPWVSGDIKGAIFKVRHLFLGLLVHGSARLFSLSSPKLFLSLFLTVLQNVINKSKTEAKSGQMQIRTKKNAPKTQHIFLGRRKQRTSVTLRAGTCPASPDRACPRASPAAGAEFHSTWQHRAFGDWAVPPPKVAFWGHQPQSHPQPWPRSEDSCPCAAESPLKACSENVGGHLDQVRPYTEPLLHHKGCKSIWEILGALWAPGWHFQTHPRHWELIQNMTPTS